MRCRCSMWARATIISRRRRAIRHHGRARCRDGARCRTLSKRPFSIQDCRAPGYRQAHRMDAPGRPDASRHREQEHREFPGQHHRRHLHGAVLRRNRNDPCAVRSTLSRGIRRRRGRGACRHHGDSCVVAASRAQSAAGSAGREQCENRVPLAHEPRYPHTAQRHHRHPQRERGARRGRGIRVAEPQEGPRCRRSFALTHQRCARHEQDRG